MAAVRKRGTRKKKIIKIAQAVIHVRSTFNNTIIAMTDKQGNVLVSSSTGMVGFSGSKKSTPFAAQRAASEVIARASEAGVKEIEIWVKGPGPGKDAVIKSFQNAGFTVTNIRDLTGMPHNGCRPRKKRRV